jgi:predicted ATPase
VDDAVAAVFSVSAPGSQSSREALVEFLRSKQLLLVLDNCEHLLEGAAALAEALQHSCERLVILATSREGLGIEGERLVPVPPLGVPAADLAAITQARRPPASTAKLRCSRVASSEGVMAATRAAASSIASGIPSRRKTTPATATAFSAVTAKSGLRCACSPSALRQ